MKCKRSISLLVSALIALAMGCASSKSESAKPAAGRAANTPPAPPAQVSPDIPEGAAYTIYCQTFSGPSHVLQAKQAKENLIATSGLNNWHLVHGEQETTLYYGFYSSTDATTADGQRARDERARIDALTDARGDRPFRYSMVVPLNSPDPLAPPQWNLENAPADKFWSLQIGAYKDNPQRKLMAVESVRDARAAGVEAYYYHGENVSHVCVGAWPRGAIREQETDQAAGDPSKPLMVLPPGLPEDLASKISLPDRQEATRIMPKVQVVDSTLKEVMEKYPHHAVNGELQMHKVRNPQSGGNEEVPEPSLIVVIPRRSPSILGGDAPAEPPVEAAPQPPQPRQPAAGTGRLKSIGE